ncbi:uncharacterized protein LOC118202724 [Stegodyphus dumicola]|uniref:uncharacterized protein LOC118202724 n=1 Tax=Stegodyphus dumicola TaxID=202533 RepID=UPI0015A86A03|nr:uncharacterized protein LOC118202724 [Stegodyphus dumicola]
MGISKIGFMLVLCILVLRILTPVGAQEEEDQQYSKRSTMLLNRLMHALNKSFHYENLSIPQMDLQRRGEGKMYWKCYFNAVSCFRRK